MSSPDVIPSYRSYIPSTDADIAYMLGVVGVSLGREVPTIDALYEDVTQDKIVAPGSVKLPQPMNEQELRTFNRRLAGRNLTGVPMFLGAGAYRHPAPSIVSRIIFRDEYETAYTPYAPEISQATLQTIFDYQTMMCYLTDMEVANTGMLDEATALAEAALMALRITGRSRIAALDTVHPNSLDAVRNYGEGKSMPLDLLNPDSEITLTKDTAALLVQYPNFYGYLEDMKRLANIAHENGSLFIVSVDNPTSLGILKRPGSFGADIVVGNGQCLGLPLDLGGMNVGIFASRMKYVRQMPGRIVGRTTDKEGRIGYVLTLQTREQHIKREDATSNICTAEALMALATTIYLADYGRDGFRDLARLNVDLAHKAAAKIHAIPGYEVVMDKPFFNEFVVKCPKSPTLINRALLERKEGKIIGGLDVSSDQRPNAMLVCVTEANSEEETNQLVAAFEEYAA